MEIKSGVPTTLTASYGASRTGKTVSVAVLDTGGNVVGSGFTLGSVIELGRGYYGVEITFSSPFVGYIAWDNSDDDIILYDSVLVLNNDSESLRKIETNRWKILDNQFIIYDDDGTTVLYTWNLFLNGVANGDFPNERVPV